MFEKVLILGSGYTGGRLATEARQRGVKEVFETHRTLSSGLPFSLDHQSTWPALPTVDLSFWTFPPVPADLVSRFLAEKRKYLGKIVVIGSTGSFLPPKEFSGELTETSTLDEKEERVRGERYLLQAGALVVRAAGIYGPDRDPRRWVESGKVGNTPRFVNFIHVEDLVQILWAAADRGKESSEWIAADSQPQRWDELIAIWQKTENLKIPEHSTPSSRASKRLNAAKSLETLGVKLKYPDIFAGIRALNQQNLKS